MPLLDYDKVPAVQVPQAVEMSLKCLCWELQTTKPRMAQVVVAGSAIGEMAMHFIEQAGLMAVRIPSKFDLRRFCRCAQPHGQHCRPGELVLSFCCLKGSQQSPMWCKGSRIVQCIMLHHAASSAARQWLHDFYSGP